MIKKRLKLPLLVSALLAMASGHTVAQESKRPLVVSVFNVGTQLPGKVFTWPVHPGFSAGTEFRYNSSPVNQWFQTARLGLFYHQFTQTALQLYSEAGYRRVIWKGIGAELRMGGGYLHSFPDLEVFEMKKGAYEKKRQLGRPQAMAGAALGISYTLPSENARLFVDYQFFMQMPFVKSYVPLLPNTALHLGAAVPFFKK
jgi:hypothetical protein